MEDQVKEGKATLLISKGKISRELPVFYNPVMEWNRTSSIFLLNTIAIKDMRIALPLAGSGARGIRMLLELDKGLIREISFNDHSEKAIASIHKNLKLNKIKLSEKIHISQKEATQFLLESSGFDYIDLDPFGTPNPFLDAAVKRISRGGILAVTATDTSALSGTHPLACQRKYWAEPKRDSNMHERGLRILIRKIQLIAAQFDKALLPILSFSKDHYMRVYLQCKKGKKDVDNIMKQHGIWDDSGPLWLGQLQSTELLKKMKDLHPFFTMLYEESLVNTIGILSLPKLCKEIKHNPIPKKLPLIQQIKKLGYQCSETHIDLEAIRTTMPKEELIALIRKQPL